MIFCSAENALENSQTPSASPKPDDYIFNLVFLILTQHTPLSFAPSIQWDTDEYNWTEMNRDRQDEECGCPVWFVISQVVCFQALMLDCLF